MIFKQFKISSKLFFVPLLLILFSLLAIQGCKKDGFNGGMEVEMTDSPGDYAAVDVEITQVEAHHESEGWFMLSSESKTYTVTDLTNGATARIGNNNEVKSGRYDKLRLSFGANSGIQSSLGSSMVSFEATASSQVEIPINVEVEANSTANVLIDFHVGESVISTFAGFELDPTITWVEDKETGLRGSLEANAKAWLKCYNSNNSYDTYSNSNGEFMLQGMASGTYTLEVYPRSDQGFPNSVTFENVTVVDGQITSTGTLNLQ